MLSYRHSYHAGNFADVLKHLVLVDILSYMGRKDAAFDYIDTHAGAGSYQLRSAHGQKLQEYTDGIGRLIDLDWPELAPYLALVRGMNRGGNLHVYPGSPELALTLMRPQDRAWLYELHPTDYRLLCRNTARHRKVKVLQEDGFAALPGLLPPASRRGLVLIDPSYEIKSDYTSVVKVLQEAYRRFATGTYTLWYPVVDRLQIDRLERDLKATGMRNIQRFELGVCPDGTDLGMTASGMVVINPNWGLLERMQALLPRLATILGRNGQGQFRCDVLVEE